MLKPLSPGLQPSDLRTISTGPAHIYSLSEAHSGSAEVFSSQQDPSSPDLLFQAQHVTVFPDGVDFSDECPPSNPSSPSGSSSSSLCGFYSFVEDPRSPEAGLNQAWMVSPQRHAQLATLKMERGFKLQTYTSSRKPQSLFSENGEEQQYQLDGNHGVEAEEEEEEDEKLLRKEIIRHQAPRGASRLMEALDLTSRTEQLSPAAPSTINKDSINFTAARQQFLGLEQGRASAPLKPGSPSKTHTKASPRPEEDHHEDTSRSQEHQQSSVAHVLDSGLEGRSPPPSVVPAWSSSSRRQPSAGNAGGKRSSESAEQETPIEREIRLLQQREENLRRSRGLKISTAEIVEIKTKRLQSPLSPRNAKDLQQGLQTMQRKDKPQLVDVQEEDRPDPGNTQRRREESPQSGDATDFPSPCCPHRHPETESARRFQPDSMASTSDLGSPHPLTTDTPRSWRENLQLNGLQTIKSGDSDFIEKEIEEALKREEELRELRTARDDSFPQAFPPAKEAARTTASHFLPATRAGTHVLVGLHVRSAQLAPSRPKNT